MLLIKCAYPEYVSHLVRCLHFKTQALLSECSMGTCRSLFSTRTRMSHWLCYTRAHVALSLLRARACCTVFATRACILHCLCYKRAHVALSLLHARAGCTVLSTRGRMLDCLRYTRAHVALPLLHERAYCTVLTTRVCMLFFQAKSRAVTSRCLSLICDFKNSHVSHLPIFLRWV